MRQEQRSIDLEHVGCQALHTNHGMGGVWPTYVLPDARLQVEERRDRTRIQRLDLDLLDRLPETAFALALEPEAVGRPAIITSQIP